MPANQQTVSLVLGSGGARGLAHIGVIHWLQENGYEIRSISGCSIGALVGGIFACGSLDTYEEWVRAITKLDIVKLLDISWGKQGLVEGERIMSALETLIGDRSIEDLPIAYTAVATDIRREKEVWLKRGSLFTAMRASIAMPLFFTPLEKDGMKLLDGGILNPVPIAPTLEDHTDLTVAVNLYGPPSDDANSEPDTKPPAEPDANDETLVGNLHTRIGRFIDDIKTQVTPDDPGNWKMLNIANQTYHAMQGTIARQRLAAYPPDHTIVIARNACGALEFDRADEMIELGYETAARLFAGS